MVAAQSKIQAFLAPAPILRPLAARPVNAPNPAAAPQSTTAPTPSDTIELSPQARQAAEQAQADTSSTNQAADPSAATDQTGEPLSKDEERELRELKQRDAEVRAHEQAHVAAAGALFRGGPTYDLQKGPDGKDYAVGGSVSIDSDPVPGDPEATITKMQQVRRAALAPADPSSTDRRIAAQATKAEAQARQELAEQRAEEQQGTREEQTTNPTTPTDRAAPDETNLTPDFDTGYTNAAIANSLKLPRLIDVAA